ncbi:hypothetical protein [Streptomyces albireticuli]|uniref:Uncharacterized protein n=1 Tax=Streptomyces albireticuli TaxID=1940 RepID=A0A2A2D508_9ACTN|nr:hypothetical protein [Streptomyces albireticuli]MCD9142216.1 hypothetical protein [Streptomyces albireticuli]MCD9162530.1 hypothetical protein [Streptomyces albireticuli]MCD9190390.1 hypothetical protein [Streptomyces albireticuli]PAU47578.1 hypothetical protein CK936_18025 [Streptomyces albireticuli]
MSAKHRIVAATVLTAAAGAVIWPTAGAVAADAAHRDGRPGGPATATVREVRLPDGSQARLTSRDGRTSATVTTRDSGRHILDGAHPAADLDHLHLRLLGGDTSRPTLRATLDGSARTQDYAFPAGSGDSADTSVPAGTSGTTLQAAHRTDGTAAAPAAPADDIDHRDQQGERRRDTTRIASSNPVKRAVEAGEAIKGRHDIGTPALAGATALALAGAGAYGVRVALRRRGPADA